MRERQSLGWKTDFGRWISAVSARRIVEAFHDRPDLRITTMAVYHWIGGAMPEANKARALVALSQEPDLPPLTYETIYRHADQLEALEREDNDARVNADRR